MVLGAPRGYYDPYDDVPRGPPRGSRSLGGILSMPNMLFNMFANTGLGKCLINRHGICEARFTNPRPVDKSGGSRASNREMLSA